MMRRKRLGNAVFVAIIIVVASAIVSNAQMPTTCKPSMGDLISNQTNHASLASTWIEALNYGPILDSTIWNVTAFAPADVIQLQAVQTYKQWAPDSSLNGTDNDNYLATVLLYNAIRGKYQPNQLIAAGAVNTLLGEVKGEDIMLTFSQDDQGYLTVQGLGNSAPLTVSGEVLACNGILYMTDGVLLPTAKSSDIEPVVLKSGQYSNLLMNANSCGSNFIGYASNVSSAEYVQMMNSTGLGAILGSPDFAGTVILPRQLSPALLNDSDAFVKTVLYNTLPGSFCPSELAKAGSMNTVLGNATNSSQPLTFSNNNQGSLTIASADGASSQTVQSYRTLCNKVVLVVDDMVPLPQTANTLTAAPNNLADDIQSLPPRRLTCNVTSYSTDTSNTAADNANQQSTTSATANVGVIVGATIGGVAALALIATAAIFIRKRAKNKNRQPPATGYQSSKSSSTGNTHHSHSSHTEDSLADITIIPNDMNTARMDLDDDDLGDDSAEGRKTEAGSRQLAELFRSYPDLSPMYIERADISIDRDEKKQRILLGSGSFGYVYRGKLCDTIPIALKVLIRPGVQAEKAFLAEAKMLQDLDQSNSNIVRIFGISIVMDKLVLIMELMQGGDLRQALDHDPEGMLDWDKYGKKVALDITHGLVCLHSKKIIHRDLKSKNILLTSRDESTMVAKIGDVGVAAMLSNEYLSSTNNVVGTLAWSAPELLLGERCNAKVDVYSLGIVLWEIVTKQVPKRGFVAMPAPSEKAPKELIDLIMQCTHKYHYSRPTAAEVYQRLQAI